MSKCLWALIALCAVAESVHAQQPPDVVASDAYDNTAMGTSALSNLTPSYPNACNCYLGYSNTASGNFALNANTTGSYNTASGDSALIENTTGSDNTASGFLALADNTTGSNNSAFGSWALARSTGNANTAIGAWTMYATISANGQASGSNNTALGTYALFWYSTANNNTASGMNALYSNTTGNSNTASGYGALYGTPPTGEGAGGATGSNNTGIGTNTLYSYSTGSDNTASGYEALYSNTTGDYNNASGFFALRYNSTGSQNSASGVQALYTNKTGNYNTASGTDALYSNTTGSTNIAEGYKAGYNLTTGSNNIDIGNQGVAADSATIRIGTTSTQTKTFIAGIYGTSVSGSAVVVSSTGQLGVTVSSERFKTAIAPMGSNSDKLQELRPVTFHLKTDPKGALQYGLIAEDVAKVYPDLVIRNESGRIDGVRYDELAPMLLNEVQQQKRQMVTQAEVNAAQAKRDAATAAQIRELREEVAQLKTLNQATQAALRDIKAKDERVAER
jgi:hypothetical protein